MEIKVSYLQFLSVVAALAAAGSVGWLSGSMTGETGHDPVVVGAVIPAMISAMGVIVGVLVGRRKSKATIVVSLFAICFCLFFFVGNDYTVGKRAAVAKAAVEEELRLRIEFRRRYLQWCSGMEYVINRDRDKVNLDPLSSEVVCKPI